MTAKDKNQSGRRSLSEVEQQAVMNMKTRQLINQDIFRVVGSDDIGTWEVEPVYATDLAEEDVEAEFASRVYTTTGSVSQQVGLDLLIKACEALKKPADSLNDSVRHLNTVAKAMQALEPRDEVEGPIGGAP